MGEPNAEDDEPEEPTLVVDEMAVGDQWEEQELEGLLLEITSEEEPA